MFYIAFLRNQNEAQMRQQTAEKILIFQPIRGLPPLWLI
jgi:hypothetical protein